MNKKLITSALLTTLAIFTFVGCGKKKTTNKTTVDPQTSYRKTTNKNTDGTTKNVTTKNVTTKKETTKKTTAKKTTEKKTTTEKKIEVVDGNYLYANGDYLTHAIVEDKKLVSLKLFTNLTNCYIITPTIVDGEFEKISITLPLHSEYTEPYMIINRGDEFTPISKQSANLGNYRTIVYDAIRVSYDRIEIQSLNKTTTIYLNGDLNDSFEITDEIIDYNGMEISYEDNVISASYDYGFYSGNIIVTIDENSVVSNVSDRSIYTTAINGNTIINKAESKNGDNITLGEYYSITLDENGYISTYEEPVWNGKRIQTYTYSNNYHDLTIHFDNPGDSENDDWDSVFKFDDYRREIVDDGYTTTYDKMGNITKYACYDYEVVYTFTLDNKPASRLNYYRADETSYYLSSTELYTFNDYGRMIGYKGYDNKNNNRLFADVSGTYDKDGNELSYICLDYDNDGQLESSSIKRYFTYEDGVRKSGKIYSICNHAFYLSEEIEFTNDGIIDSISTYYDENGLVIGKEYYRGYNAIEEEIYSYRGNKLFNFKDVFYEDTSMYVQTKITSCIDVYYNETTGAITSVKMYVNDKTNPSDYKYYVYTIKNEYLNDRDAWNQLTNYTFTETKSGLYTLDNGIIW